VSSRHYRDSLIQAMDSADHDGIVGAAEEWRLSSDLLAKVSERVRSSGTKIKSEIEGEAGEAMVAKFTAISDKLDLDATSMMQGSEALGIAADTALEAIKTRNGIQQSGPMNQMPTKPEGPLPGAPPTPKQTQDLATYNAGVAQYEANEQAAETKAQIALQQLDKGYGDAALAMKEIHGIPDPEEPSSPTNPAGPGTTPPVSGPRVPTNDDPRDPVEPRDDDPRDPVDPPDPHDPDDPRDPVDPRDPRDPVDPRDPEDPRVPITNVRGGTDGGTSYHGVNAGGSSSAGSTSAGVGGAAAAGVAGAGLGAGMLKGGAISGSVKAPSTGSVRGIGAGGRAGGPSSLGRGATASGSAARGASSGTRAGGASRSAGASGRAGAAGASGAKGSAAKGGARGGAAKGGAGRAGAAGSTGGKGTGKGASKGKGLFRRGANGSTAGGRSNKKDDERGTERDSLVYEQDWLGEDTAAPGVLD